MTSAHRYPPPQTSSQNDFRLPSLKDLNFAYRPPVSGPQPALPPTQSTELGVIQQEHPQTTSRHPAAWGRTAMNGSATAPSSVAGAHQQHASSQSAGHDVPSKVDYASKHENGGYAHPGIPLSAQATPVPGSVNTRNENAHSPNQPKRQRTSSSTNMPPSRDVRPVHPNGYPPPQYASYPPVSQPQQQSPYHPVQQSLSAPPPHTTQSAPPPHEQVHHQPPPMPVTAHNGYPSYQQHAYVQPRQTLLHPQHSPHPPPPQQNHSNPYPSPGPPPPAPPPQGPWAQSHQPQPQHQHHHQPPPPHQQQAPPPQPPPPQAQPPQHAHQPHPSHAPPPHHHQQHQQQQHQHHQQHQPQPTTIPPSSMHNIPPSQPAPPPPPAHTHVPPHHQAPVQPQQPPQYAQHQSYPQQQQPQPQPQQSFHRPTTIAPTALEARPTYTPAPPEPPRAPSVQNDAMAEITNHCTVLHNFAHRYASLQQTMPHAQPPVAELEEMSRRALTVVRLLQEFRQITLPGDVPVPQAQTVSSQNTPEESRPPKRPWEDVSQEEGASGPDPSGFQDQFPANPPPTSEGKQTTAEQDMELIRTKRATSTAVANGSAGQPKSKYRKRSRASPPGKCHSCNIRETPEWRRGPDGARTLCNACGLHYAKLMRKQSKATNGDAPPIDLETLRASARAADIADKASRSTKPQSSSKASAQQPSASPDSPMDTGAAPSSQAPASKPNGIQQPQPQPTPTGTHQGSFQILMSEHAQPPQPPQNQTQNQNQPTPSSSSAMQVDSRPPSQQAPTPQMQHQPHVPPPPPHHAHPSAMGMPPPPPWPTTARGSYGPPPEHIQHAHQSFMRGSAQQASR
ncbi:hypothetical protein CPB83DRAFT_899754 [Crepidotus variabilis]|uniref:GATA-type domain-containing protein n=1 Tax=Crepidotus variabilis TaxID=179855 RepID=A0A9P6JII1_9AGAR|nr:hypothetical protein CPB83DRAFT_899754 [Crepidotus variabilis]